MLQAQGARLSLPLLAARLERSRDRLAAVRLTPMMLSGRIATARERLDSFERLRLQLDPRAPLKRGYVLVSDDAGVLVRSAEQARASQALRLEFADGAVDAVPAARRAGQQAKSPLRETPSGSDRPRQGDLF